MPSRHLCEISHSAESWILTTQLLTTMDVCEKRRLQRLLQIIYTENIVKLKKTEQAQPSNRFENVFQRDEKRIKHWLFKILIKLPDPLTGN